MINNHNTASPIPLIDTVHHTPLNRKPVFSMWARIPCQPDSKWQGFIGRTINVPGFAQDCVITNILNRYDDEWAVIQHERFGTLYRKTSSLFVKDLVEAQG